jgi:hypothetical protein
MAKYKAYPEYKDSGVEWLKVILKWRLFKVKFTHFRWFTPQLRMMIT